MKRILSGQVKRIPVLRRNRGEGITRAKILQWAAGLSAIQMIEESKRGISGHQLEWIQEESHFSSQDWSKFLQLAPRTIQRYRKQNSLIDSASSERVLMMAQIVERGKEVFGSEERFSAWLNAPSYALAGRDPLQLLDTTTGMLVVKAELTRIEHGVF